MSTAAPAIFRDTAAADKVGQWLSVDASPEERAACSYDLLLATLVVGHSLMLYLGGQTSLALFTYLHPDGINIHGVH